jgi:hypothetical protein
MDEALKKKTIRKRIITIYDQATGAIMGTVSCPYDIHLKNYTYVDGQHSGNENYVVDGKVISRPSLSTVIMIDKTVFAADGEDSVTINNLPNPCVVSVVNLDNNRCPIFNDEVTDGKLILTTKESGVYRITVNCFPYQQYTAEIEATKCA